MYLSSKLYKEFLYQSFLEVCNELASKIGNSCAVNTEVLWKYKNLMRYFESKRSNSYDEKINTFKI